VGFGLRANTALRAAARGSEPDLRTLLFRGEGTFPIRFLLHFPVHLPLKC
jgi:hypothetical protein